MSILKTSLSTAYRPSFAALDGLAFIVNGFDRNMTYDGESITNMSMRMTGGAPTQNAQSADGSMDTLSVVKFRYEYWNANKGYPSARSGTVTLTLTGSNTAVTINIPADTGIDSQVTHARVYRTTKGGNIYRLDTSQSGGLVAFTGTAVTFKSTVADSALTTIMGELNEAGNANVDIHGAWPTLAYLTVHEGRLLGTGKIKYTTGTVTMDASATVEGASTLWVQGLVGQKFQVDSDPRIYTISSVTDADTLVLSESYSGTTGAGKSYTIFGENGSFVWMSYTGLTGLPFPESVPTTYFFSVDKDSNDENTGLYPIKNGTLISRYNSLWVVTGSTQSQISIPYRVSGPTGFVPHTMANDDDMNVIGTGEQGIYITDGTMTRDLIATTIKNIFTNVGSPPWYVNKSRLDNMHSVFLNKRYYVWVASGTTTYEDKCIVLDFNVPMPDGAPSVTVFSLPATTSAIVEDSNKKKYVYFGWKGFTNYIDSAATNDGAGSTSTVTGTVTASDATSLTDSSATYTDDVLGCRVVILSGTGINSTGFISARTATKITVESAWSTTPAVGDTYAIAYIDAYRKSKWRDFDDLGDKTIRQVRIAFNQVGYSINFKLYGDFSSTATIDKDVSMDEAKEYWQYNLGNNRFRHHQVEFSLRNPDEPFELREVELNFFYSSPNKDKF